MTIMLSGKNFARFSSLAAASTLSWRPKKASKPKKKTKRLLPSLVILNFSLPDMSGFELALELKAITPELPVFMLTTDYSVTVEKKALSYGITAVFSKLDDLATLVANARAVCGIE
jgi:DNA-binding response OmpR family regulator